MKNFFYLSDIGSVFKLRIKLLCSSKKFICLFAFFLCMIAMIMSAYEEVSNEKNTLPIGIVDLDNTAVSRDVINEINSNGLLRVVTGTKKELLNKLNKNEVFSVFVLEEGFTNKLLSLDTYEIIEDNYSTENRVSKVISDSVLAGILDEICYTYCNKTYYKNTKLYSNVFENKQYMKYIKSIYEQESETLAFDFIITNSKASIDNNKLDTEFLYKEIIFAISALVSVIIVLIIGDIFIDDSRLGMDKRYIISGINKSALLLGDIMATIFVSSLFGLIVSGLLVSRLNMESIEKSGKIMLLIFLFECTISILFVLLAKSLNDIVSYQLVGSIVILFVGVSGAMYILGFMINDVVATLVKFTPIGLLVNGYKNVILGSSISFNILFFITQCVIMYMVTYIVVCYKKYVLCIK